MWHRVPLGCFNGVIYVQSRLACVRRAFWRPTLVCRTYSPLWMLWNCSQQAKRLSAFFSTPVVIDVSWFVAPLQRLNTCDPCFVFNVFPFILFVTFNNNKRANNESQRINVITVKELKVGFRTKCSVTYRRFFSKLLKAMFYPQQIKVHH